MINNYCGMWILKKPTSSSAKKDIDVLIDHCRNLDHTHKVKLLQLYDDYDKGNGQVTDAQLLPLEDKADVIRRQYEKTYNTKNNNQLDYIRKELMQDVSKCPYCSINEPVQLDHYMDKGKYGQLATCRLNLVPLCAKCNWLKSDTTYKDFTHPYYQVFPAVSFLVANCQVVKGRIVILFSLDKASIADNALFNKLSSQMSHLQLNLRLRKCSQEFITNVCMSCMAYTDPELQFYLARLLMEITKMYGLNDWRTAIIRGLQSCPQFDIKIVNNLKSSISPINGIGV